MRRSHPLERLERDVLDDSVPLASVLRQVLVIGGHASSQPLRTWALQELHGYTNAEVELPDYRKGYAPMRADARSVAWQIKGETITKYELPEFAREYYSEEVPIPFGVGKIEAMIARTAPDEPLRLSPPGAAELARFMTYDRRDRRIVIEAVYWAVDVSVLQDVLDQVRTRLTQFVAELRDVMPAGESDPTPEQVHRAVQSIHITAGDNSPVNLTAPMAYADGDSSATASAGEKRSRWWRRK
ncbi:hypothetical protein GA0115240_15415 [Streptomyces sp. DvalAA-14]|uniref:AbiTii domain-containing protein n=1 Tax=unclassified Streptomyces TaxID=2593676 RepID=UPI00081BA644|nr:MULTISPECIES: hypothetical protein [unclassified Streptomyces]MYS23569.1 hypothetical protein [Streptomyces sp. SID4948]SCE35534.1 hypothetical protein GA0115240_15415 [Streptomyces sp. DvalAA-14]